MERARLDAALLRAHACDDRGGLVDLYTQAADLAQESGAKAFFLTQAYIFALDTGHAAAAALRARLVEMGCE